MTVASFTQDLRVVSDMPDVGTTIVDGFQSTGINANGELIWEHDTDIDNIDFSIDANGNLIYARET